MVERSEPKFMPEPVAQSTEEIPPAVGRSSDTPSPIGVLTAVEVGPKDSVLEERADILRELLNGSAQLTDPTVDGLTLDTKNHLGYLRSNKLQIFGSSSDLADYAGRLLGENQKLRLDPETTRIIDTELSRELVTNDPKHPDHNAFCSLIADMFKHCDPKRLGETATEQDAFARLFVGNNNKREV